MAGWLIRVSIPGANDEHPAEEFYAAWLEDTATAIASVEGEFNPEEGVTADCRSQLSEDELTGLGVSPGEALWLPMLPEAGRAGSGESGPVG